MSAQRPEGSRRDTIPAPPPAVEQAPAASTGRRPRGFALLSPEQRREIARRGGIAGHAQGVAHRFTPDQAREAGRKGGLASHARRRASEGSS